MDLERLKIDREPSSASPRSAGRTGGRRRGAPRGLGTLLFLLLLAAGVWWFRRPLLELGDRLRLPVVEVARVIQRSPAAAGSVAGATANGYVVAKTRAALSADTPGRIVELNVEEGSVVREGDVVARLFYDEFEASLRRAEADVTLAEASLLRTRAEADAATTALEVARSTLAATEADIEESDAARELAQANYDRVVGLVERRVESEQRLDEVRAELDRANAGLRATRARRDATERTTIQAESQKKAAEASVQEGLARLEVLKAARDLAAATLDKTFVRAPFDGIVVLKDAEVGEVVSPNSQGGSNARGSVVTMVDFTSLEVQAEVPETTLSAVRLGARARVYLDAFPDAPYTGRVSRIWPTANRSKATVEVRVTFERLDENLRPEMGVRVVFVDEDLAAETPEDEAAAEPVVLVPQDAVLKLDGRDGVFLLDRDTVVFRELVLGASTGSRVAVDEGLEGGEEVVLRPPASLRDGDRVRRAAKS